MASGESQPKLHCIHSGRLWRPTTHAVVYDKPRPAAQQGPSGHIGGRVARTLSDDVARVGLSRNRCNFVTTPGKFLTVCDIDPETMLSHIRNSRE
jgi:hypothetical protein